MAIRRRRTSRASSGSTQSSSVGGGGVKALQNTVWDFMIPGIPLTPVMVFSFEPYSGATGTGDVGLEDILGLLGNGDFQTCNFPVYPKVGLQGLIIKTNIPDFVQYADAPLESIPASLSETIEVASDKAQYIGCDNGSSNISQSGLRIKKTPKILSISSISQNEVVISLDIFDLPQNIFKTLGDESFFPYNAAIAVQAGILVPVDTYLNRGQIAATGIYARHLPSAKNTSKTTLSTNFDFTIG